MWLKSGLLAMGQRCEWEVLSCPQWMHIWGACGTGWVVFVVCVTVL